MKKLIELDAALDALADYIHNVDRVYSTGKLTHEDCMDAAHSVLDKLPSAQPDVTDTNVGDMISRQAALDALGEEPPVWYDGEDEIAERNQWRRDVAAIKALPSAQQERKKGKWLSHYDYCEKHGYIPSGLIAFWWCNQCEKGVEIQTNFCPNCGADMRGENGG